MNRVTSNLQVTIPRALAERHGIRPGDDGHFDEVGEFIRMMPADSGKSIKGLDIAARLRLFDAATVRQHAREVNRQARRVIGRGWTREELYERGSPDY